MKYELMAATNFEARRLTNSQPTPGNPISAAPKKHLEEHLRYNQILLRPFIFLPIQSKSSPVSRMRIPFTTQRSFLATPFMADNYFKFFKPWLLRINLIINSKITVIYNVKTTSMWALKLKASNCMTAKKLDQKDKTRLIKRS